MKYGRTVWAAVAGLCGLGVLSLVLTAAPRESARADAEDGPIATGRNDWVRYGELPSAPSPAVQPAAEAARAEEVENLVARAGEAALAQYEATERKALNLTLAAVSDAPFELPRDAQALAFPEPAPSREVRVELGKDAAPAVPVPVRAERAKIFAFAAVKGDAAGMVIRDRSARGLRAPEGRWAVEKIANIGDVQLGVGWRKGAVQASIALIDREIRIEGREKHEGFLAFTLSVKPRKAKAARAV